MSDPTTTMVPMSVRARALALQRLLREHAAMRLLRSDNLAVAAAVLTERLGAPGARMTAEDLFEAVEGDLEELRTDHELPQTARAYCDAWREAGLLVRRPVVGGRGETYELSPQARDALRLLEQLDAPRSTLTESRLVSLATALHQLAIDTDPDVTRRIAAIEAEIGRLTLEVERLRSGDGGVLDAARARERTEDVLGQAGDLPGDFARVRARFEELNAELRTRILESEETQSRVLDDVFRGVDVIAASDEGRTFAAFSALLRDPERSASLDADIAAVLGRPFADTLDPLSRRALRTLVRDLKGGSREVHGVLTEFARGLRRYVHSQEFQRDRQLRGQLAEALAAAVPVSRRLRPYTALGSELDLSSLPMRSVGELGLHDPTDFESAAVLADQEPQEIDFQTLALLARESEIDMAELVGNVNTVLTTRGSATVAQVLGEFPATQGVASVIGLLSLATRFGVRRNDESEHLSWDGLDGVARQALVPTHAFTTAIEE